MTQGTVNPSTEPMKGDAFDGESRRAVGSPALWSMRAELVSSVAGSTATRAADAALLLDGVLRLQEARAVAAAARSRERSAAIRADIRAMTGVLPLDRHAAQTVHNRYSRRDLKAPDLETIRSVHEDMRKERVSEPNPAHTTAHST